jgi:hypothetical protein
MRLTGKKSFEKILCFVSVCVCVVLHNFLVGKREDNLGDADEDLSDIDANNELNRPIPDHAESASRCEQVKNYVFRK